MNEFVALLEALRPVLERWYLVLFAIVIVTLLGIPARLIVGSVAALLRVPAAFARTDVDPVLRRATPTTPYRLLRNLRDYFRPVLDRPAQSLERAATYLFDTMRNAPRWPVGAITGAIVGLVSPLVDQAATHAENGSARLGAQAQSSASALRGNSNRWAGWRVIGGFLFFAGLLLFLYADAALSIASHEKAIGAPVSFLPEWFREITLAYAIASFVAALMLGLVFFDLMGMTHLGPWDDLEPRPRSWLSRTALALAVAFLLLSLFLALWRASVIVPDFISKDVADKLLGIALTAPIPLMLLATALIAWGAIAMPWLVWILAVGGLAIVMLLVALVLRAVSRALPPLAVLLGGVLRVLGIAGLVVLLGLVSLAAGVYFVLAVLAVGVVFVGAFFLLALWAAVWLIAEAIVFLLRLVARLGDAIAFVLQALIDALMWPGRVLWNWFASFDRTRAMHIQPIKTPEARALRLASGEQPALEEAAR
ncbi:MAG TPA: hypothetical protein VGR87_11360 [Candidatus Limnocylindria bacterium]|jgi:hypothetical protein|nr:hypothetical protein [Candidatus Limnocylindria bacterium]